MGDPEEHKRRTADSFDDGASAYVKSDVHRRGDDLEQLARWMDGTDRVLDVATGAGHTAGAVSEHTRATVVASDAAPGMVRTATASFDGVIGVLADAEQLPFDTDSFDGVTCRIAAHHFPDPRAFVSEVGRVLAPGGAFAFEDNIAPADSDLDAFLNRIERLRDPTHVRSRSESQWRSLICESGFEIERSFVIEKEIRYDAWVEQLDTPRENRRELESLLRDASQAASDCFSITIEDGSIRSFSNLKLVLLARIDE